MKSWHPTKPQKSYPTFPCLQQRSQAIHICHTGAHEASGLPQPFRNHFLEHLKNFFLDFWGEPQLKNLISVYLCVYRFLVFLYFVWWISLLGEFRSLDLLLSSMVLLISLAFLSGFFQIRFHSSKECAVSTCFQCRYHEGIKIHRSTTTKRQSSQPHTYIYQSFLALIECNIIPPVASSVYICHKHSNEKLKVNTY